MKFRELFVSIAQNKKKPQSKPKAVLRFQAKNVYLEKFSITAQLKFSTCGVVAQQPPTITDPLP